MKVECSTCGKIQDTKKQRSVTSCCDNPKLFVTVLGNDGEKHKIGYSKLLSYERSGHYKKNILNIFEDSKTKKKKFDKIDLEKLHKIYSKNLHIEDSWRLDVILAVRLSANLEGIPLWIFFVGASGDNKNGMLMPIYDENDTKILHNLTPKTLVNGYKDKKKYPDLAPQLDKKIILIPDMSQILKLPPNDKSQLWGQLRDLYDGFAGRSSGMGSDVRYEGIKVTLLANSTPAIDSQILINQDLGTRELIYRTKGNKKKSELMDVVFENEEIEEQVKTKLKEATQNFLANRELKRTKVSDKVLEEIKKISEYVTYMRVTAEYDYSNELRNVVYPEEPTRISKQLKRLFICLKALDDGYSDERALKILWHIGRSCAFPIRMQIFNFLLECKGKEFSTSQIAEFFKIGKSTAKRECAVFENLEMVTCRRKETSYPDRPYEYWKINSEHPFVKALLSTNRPDIYHKDDLDDKYIYTIKTWTVSKEKEGEIEALDDSEGEIHTRNDLEKVNPSEITPVCDQCGSKKTLFHDGIWRCEECVPK